MDKQLPTIWSGATIQCPMHQLHPGMGGLENIIQGECVPTDSAARAQTCAALVMTTLALREPRTCLFPSSEQEGAGDIVEAVLGICKPGSSTCAASAAKDLHFRAQFGLTWKVPNRDYQNLHRRFTGALRHVG
eukprot:7943222-Pyramimonas_sp.AAC.1